MRHIPGFVGAAKPKMGIVKESWYKRAGRCVGRETNIPIFTGSFLWAAGMRVKRNWWASETKVTSGLRESDRLAQTRECGCSNR